MNDRENKAIGRHDPAAWMRGWRMKDENDGGGGGRRRRRLRVNDWNAGVMGDRENMAGRIGGLAGSSCSAGKRSWARLAWKMEPRHAEKSMSKLITRGWFQWSVTQMRG